MQFKLRISDDLCSQVATLLRSLTIQWIPKCFFDWNSRSKAGST